MTENVFSQTKTQTQLEKKKSPEPKETAPIFGPDISSSNIFGSIRDYINSDIEQNHKKLKSDDLQERQKKDKYKDSGIMWANESHQRRIMTSAIDNMSVAEVRKYLGETRKKFDNQSEDNPFFITDVLSNGMTIQEFAFRFQQGHHNKRHKKCKKNNTTEIGHNNHINDNDSVIDCSSESDGDDSDNNNIFNTDITDITDNNNNNNNKEIKTNNNDNKDIETNEDEYDIFENDTNSISSTPLQSDCLTLPSTEESKKRGRPKKYLAAQQQQQQSQTLIQSQQPSTTQIKPKKPEPITKSLLCFRKK